MLRRFGLYLTKDTKNAVWVALFLGLLSLIGLPVFWMGLVLVALITLHDGPKSGLWVLGALALPVFIIGLMGDFSFAIVAIVFRGLVVFLLAWLLQRNASWVTVLFGAVCIGLLGIVIFHLWVENPAEWWWERINIILQQANVAAEAAEQLQHTFNQLSHFITGIFVATLLLYNVITLLLARGWQALLFNPGGLKKEFAVIRIPQIAAIVLLLCLIAASLGVALVQDVLPVLMLPFVMAGISLVHVGAAKKKELKVPILVLFYTLFVFLYQYLIVMLVVVGLMDSWFNFRSLK